MSVARLDLHYEDTYRRTWLESFFPYFASKYARIGHHIASIGSFLVFGYLGLVGERALWIFAVGLGLTFNPGLAFKFIMASASRASEIKQSIQVRLLGGTLIKTYCGNATRELHLSLGYQVRAHGDSYIVLQGSRCFAFPTEVWVQIKDHLPDVVAK